jgi:hypothetical protein
MLPFPFIGILLNYLAFFFANFIEMDEVGSDSRGRGPLT